MTKSRSDIKEYHEIITSVWKFFRKYAELSPLSDSQWEDCVAEAHAITAKYQDDDLQKFAARMVAGVVMNELEKINR